MAMIGSVTGLGFVCCGLAPWDVTEPLRSHHLREGPAPAPHKLLWMSAGAEGAIDHVMRCGVQMVSSDARGGPALRTTDFHRHVPSSLGASG